MPETTTNVDLFNGLVGVIFSQLYRSFPVPVEIDAGEVSRVLDADMLEETAEILFSEPTAKTRTITGHYAVEFRDETLAWLVGEGFIRRREPDHLGAKPKFQLSAKGLVTLNAVPQGLEQSLGSKLSDAVSDTGKAARGATVTELVGMIFSQFM